MRLQVTVRRGWLLQKLPYRAPSDCQDFSVIDQDPVCQCCGVFVDVSVGFVVFCHQALTSYFVI